MTKTLDVTKPVQLRDGTPCRIICVDRKGSQYPIIVLEQTKSGIESVVYFRNGGRAFESAKSSRDLVNVPQAHTCRIYLYRWKEGSKYPGKTFCTRWEELCNPNVELLSSRIVSFTEGEHDPQ